MIHKFIEGIERAANSNPIIISSDIQKYFGPDSKTVYLKGKLLFIDSSIHEIAIFVYDSGNGIVISKYRFHYMNKHGHMLFRYDNAPHHQEIPSFPYHKHAGDNVISSSPPSIKDILIEISAMMLKK